MSYIYADAVHCPKNPKKDESDYVKVDSELGLSIYKSLLVANRYIIIKIYVLITLLVIFPLHIS